MAFDKLPPIIVRMRAWSNVQPFTYEDGLTHQEMLTVLWHYIKGELIPWLDTDLDKFEEEVREEITRLVNEFTEEVNRALEKVDQVDAELQADMASLSVELRAYVDNAVASIINSTIEVSDPVISAILNDADTETNEILNARYNTGTHVYVASAGDDNNEGNIYTSPFATIARALEFIGTGYGVIHIAPGDVIKCEPFELDVQRHAIVGYRSELNFVDADPNAVCITIMGSRGSNLEQNRCVLSGLVIRGSLYTGQEVGQTAILYTSPATTGRLSPSHTFIEQVNITDFKYGITYGNNSYILTVKDSTIRHCGWCVFMPSGVSNTGEKMLFLNTVFADSAIAVWAEAANTEFFFVGCSFDYLSRGRVMYLSQARASLYACHVELDRGKENPVFEFRSIGTNFTMHGGRLSFNTTDPATTPQFVLNNMTGEGQAAVFDGVSFNGTLLPGGKFSHGPGNTIVKNALYSGGATQAESAISDSANALIDPTFSLTTIADDWFVSSDATAPTDRAVVGTNIDISLSGTPQYPGSDRALRFRKLASQGASAAGTLFVPLGYDQTPNVYGQFRVRSENGGGSGTVRLYGAKVSDYSKLPTLGNIRSDRRVTLGEVVVNMGGREWQNLITATRKRLPSWVNAILVVVDLTGSTNNSDVFVGYQHVSVG